MMIDKSQGRVESVAPFSYFVFQEIWRLSRGSLLEIITNAPCGRWLPIGENAAYLGLIFSQIGCMQFFHSLAEDEKETLWLSENFPLI